MIVDQSLLSNLATGVNQKNIVGVRGYFSRSVSPNISTFSWCIAIKKTSFRFFFIWTLLENSKVCSPRSLCRLSNAINEISSCPHGYRGSLRIWPQFQWHDPLSWLVHYSSILLSGRGIPRESSCRDVRISRSNISHCECCKYLWKILACYPWCINEHESIDVLTGFYLFCKKNI